MSEWIRVCSADAIVSETGVCALIGRVPVAVFRVGDQVHALDNRDPFTGASVLSRGIIGDRGGVLKVASPLYKQSFSLESGVCLDQPSVRVPVYGARIVDGFVEVTSTPLELERDAVAATAGA